MSDLSSFTVYMFQKNFFLLHVPSAKNYFCQHVYAILIYHMMSHQKGQNPKGTQKAPNYCSEALLATKVTPENCYT